MYVFKNVISKAMLYNGGIIVVIEGIRYGSIKCTFFKTMIVISGCDHCDNRTILISF